MGKCPRKYSNGDSDDDSAPRYSDSENEAPSRTSKRQKGSSTSTVGKTLMSKLVGSASAGSRGRVSRARSRLLNQATLQDAQAEVNQGLRKKKGKARANTRDSSPEPEAVFEETVRTVKFGMILILRCGLSEPLEQEVEEEETQNSDEPLPDLTMRLRQDEIPNARKIRIMSTCGLAVHDNNGYVVTANMDHEAFDMFLRRHIPDFFALVDSLPPVPNPAYNTELGQAGTAFLPPYAICMREPGRQNKAVVIPAAEFPTGQDVVDSCEDTKKKGWEKHYLIVASRKRIPNAMLPLGKGKGNDHGLAGNATATASMDNDDPSGSSPQAISSSSGITSTSAAGIATSASAPILAIPSTTTTTATISASSGSAAATTSSATSQPITPMVPSQMVAGDVSDDDIEIVSVMLAPPGPSSSATGYTRRRITRNTTRMIQHATRGSSPTPSPFYGSIPSINYGSMGNPYA